MSSRRLYRPAAALAVAVATLPFTAGVAHAAVPVPFTAGDVVVYEVGAAATTLGSAGAPITLAEFSPTGTAVQTVPLPTTASGSNAPIVASGTATSEGLLSLSGDGSTLVATGYDAAVGASGLSGSASATTPRTVALVNAGAAVDTSTHLTDFSDGNNPRSAVSNDGKEVWVGGAKGGIRYAAAGTTTTSTALLSSATTNVRQVSIYNGQLYTSADPTKNTSPVSVATIGTGLPTTATAAVTNLAFATAPAEPYAFSFVTLASSGTAPDTLYVADNTAGAVLKYSLVSGSWKSEGSVAIAGVLGVTARDDGSGNVKVYATSSNSAGTSGLLSAFTDSSGIGGTLSGSATTIATAAANFAFRGVAFAPGTTFPTGGGGTAAVTPTVTPAQTGLAASLNDPTNPTLGLTVAWTGHDASNVTVTAKSSNLTVAPTVSVSGTGASRTLTVTPGAVGDSTITITATGTDNTTSSTTIAYGVSADDGDSTDRYYAGAGNASAEIDLGGGYFVAGDDDNNILRLYNSAQSGMPVATFDFTAQLGTTSDDLEAATRVGNTIYWLGSLSNSSGGSSRPTTDVVFATTVSGTGATATLTYAGSYTNLREDLTAWDAANGNPLGLVASAAGDSKTSSGLNVEGLEFASGSTTTAYLAFRAPLETTTTRTKALLVPVTNFSSLPGGSVSATFGTPLEWNLGGLGIRDIRKNADNQYLVIAGTADGSNSDFELYSWDGNPADAPVQTNTTLPQIENGAWEGIVSVPDPLVPGAAVRLVEDNGDSVWYADGFTSKAGLIAPLQKDLGRTFTIGNVAASTSLPEAPWPALLVVVGGGAAFLLIARRRRTA